MILWYSRIVEGITLKWNIREEMSYVAMCLKNIRAEPQNVALYRRLLCKLKISK